MNKQRTADGCPEFREAFAKLIAEAVAVRDRFRFPRNNADLSPAEWEAFLKVEALVEYHGARERLDEDLRGVGGRDEVGRFWFVAHGRIVPTPGRTDKRTRPNLSGSGRNE